MSKPRCTCRPQVAWRARCMVCGGFRDEVVDGVAPAAVHDWGEVALSDGSRARLVTEYPCVNGVFKIDARGSE